MDNQYAHRYVVTLAGGGGKRLWPLSRAGRPKQLLPITGSLTLLETTLERMRSCAPRERQYLVTTEQYARHIEKLVGDRIGVCLTEPVSRNTAPAILLSCLEIIKHDPQALVIIVPADHVITNDAKFQQALDAACRYAAEHEKLVLLGIKPDRPATEYGYLEVARQTDTAVDAIPVVRFHEKPTSQVAAWYYQHEAMYWNAGIICAQVSVLLDEITLHAPEFIAGVAQYETLPSASIDYAVLEKSERIAMVPAEFGWSDVGSLSAFMNAYHLQNTKKTTINTLGAADNSSMSSKPVVCAGVNNLCIIETQDLIVVVDAEQMHRSAEIAEYLRSHGFEEYT